MSSADAPPPEQEAPLAPEDVSGRTFPNAFRGFDPVAVRAFLGQVADELRVLLAREAELRRLVDEAPAQTPVAGEPVDADAAAVALAEARQEAERITSEARAEADRLAREAKERVTQLGNAATAESARVMSEAHSNAQQLVRGKGEEAEATAVKKIADAEREAAAIRVKAREDSDAILEAAKERGREMLAEAQAAREKLIADITKRKRNATAQLEQLRASRDRLLEALRVVRRNLDEITTRLEATEGAAPPVAATPGDQAPAQSGEEGVDVRRPARASRVMLGELPPTRSAPAEQRSADAGAEAATAPAVRTVTTTATPRIDAPAARAAGAAGAAADIVPGTTPEEHRDDDRAEPAAPAEERRSSALRILRRHRPAARTERAVPPQVGRESTGEGIRIIRGEPDAAAEPETAVEAEGIEPRAAVEAEVVEPDEVGAGVDLDAEDAPADDDIDVVIADAVDVTAAAATVDEVVIADVAPEDLPPPLRPEEVRPRIEDLFARIRADREASVAKAREVLAAPPPSARDTADAADSDAAVEAASSADEPASDADEHALQARDAVVDPIAAQLTKRLKRAIQDEQNATLDRLRTAKARPTGDDVLASADTQPAPYRYASLPMLEQVARAAAAAAPFGAVAVGVDDLAQALADDLATQIRARVDRVLADAATDEVDLQSTSESVSAVYREWKTQRVERLAVHYLVGAWSRGTFVGTSEGTPMRWVVDDDGPCPDCDDNALAGSTPRGQQFPTGQLHPPAHVGCRCLIVAAT
jgi:DivIVA domain-containing protein